MFTGIIEETGKIVSVERRGDFAVITVGCKKVLEGTVIGDSIAVNGTCLTVTSLTGDTFRADISYETLKKSSFASASGGSKVNLERALTLITRLGGHIVSGHVDAVGTIEKLEKKSSAYILTVRYPQDIDRYIVEKGSICVDGISLTTARVGGLTFDVAVIPHTYENTSLADKRQGSQVNLEVDAIARYLEKLLKKEKDAANFLNDLNDLMG
ncbi:riboflavin synthase [Seleniivibrio woodruffii]|uniref:riboflavin synthase n=1 Tax=Seleniivibrio woodruffii TaxID=1078050 RepID=UPI00240A7522|nr:riboflavin synthase [Seleniivibrio woodruffii]